MSPIFYGGGSSNLSLDSQIERLMRCEHLRENEVKALCTRAKEILADEGNVQRVNAPVTVSGWIILISVCFVDFDHGVKDLYDDSIDIITRIRFNCILS